jgi:hypothetical protein
MDSWGDDAGNSRRGFAGPNQGCLILPCSARLFMHVWMNDRTRLLVTYLSPSACLTTTVIVVNEAVPWPIISQSSKPILKFLPSPSLISSFTEGGFGVSFNSQDGVPQQQETAPLSLPRQKMKDHVRPVLPRRIPTICVLLSALFQKRVSYFTIYMLLL